MNAVLTSTGMIDFLILTSFLQYSDLAHWFLQLDQELSRESAEIVRELVPQAWPKNRQVRCFHDSWACCNPFRRIASNEESDSRRQRD